MMTQSITQSVIPSLRRLTWDCWEFKASHSYLARLRGGGGGGDQRLEMWLSWEACLEFMKPESVGQLCTKPCMTAVACNNSLWEVEAEGSEVKGHPWLYNESETSLGYMRPPHPLFLSLKTKHYNPQDNQRSRFSWAWREIETKYLASG